MTVHAQHQPEEQGTQDIYLERKRVQKEYCRRGHERQHQHRVVECFQ